MILIPSSFVKSIPGEKTQKRVTTIAYNITKCGMNIEYLYWKEECHEDKEEKIKTGNDC